jgi:hypothetical protein
VPPKYGEIRVKRANYVCGITSGDLRGPIWLRLLTAMGIRDNYHALKAVNRGIRMGRDCRASLGPYRNLM